MDLGKKKILKSALFWGVLCSFVYLGLIVWVLRWERVFLFFTLSDLNSIGDFLAGVLGPLSIGWVVLGYWQNQGALREQANELRKTVVAANEHLEIERRKVEPDFELTHLFFVTRTKRFSKDAYGQIDKSKDPIAVKEVDFDFGFVNKGGKCPTVRVYLCATSDFPEDYVWFFDYEGREFEGIQSGAPARYEHKSRNMNTNQADFHDRVQFQVLFDQPTKPFFVKLEWFSGSGKSSVTYRSDSLYSVQPSEVDTDLFRKKSYEKNGFVKDKRILVKIEKQPTSEAD